MDKLANVHPTLVEKIKRVLGAMEILGFPMFVVQGVRGTDEQRDLYEQGRSRPGKIVTNCDGVHKKSNHQVKDDGLGHAVDCAFRDDPLTPTVNETWASGSPWAAYGACAKALGLTWGGDWSALVDRPHIELPGLPHSRGVQ